MKKPRAEVQRGLDTKSQHSDHTGAISGGEWDGAAPEPPDAPRKTRSGSSRDRPWLQGALKTCSASPRPLSDLLLQTPGKIPPASSVPSTRTAATTLASWSPRFLLPPPPSLDGLQLRCLLCKLHFHHQLTTYLSGHGYPSGANIKCFLGHRFTPTTPAQTRMR